MPALLPLTPALSPRERERLGPIVPLSNPTTLADDPPTILPLPGGEGRGEGQQSGLELGFSAISVPLVKPMTFSYRVGWSCSRCLFATYFRWRVFYPERVPLEGPVILAANHASFLDPPLVGAGLHRMLSFLARDSLFRFPLFGALLRSWNAVPVDREGTGAGLKAILERLLAGGAILLFPEGTRTTDGQLLPARSGIGLVVVKSGAPVVPVRLFGTFEAYGRHAKWPRPRPVAVKFGHLLTFDALRKEANDCSRPRLKAIYQIIADEIMAAIAKLGPGNDDASTQ